MIDPLLRVLAAAPEGLPARLAQDLVADRLQLSAEDRVRRVPGGTQVLFRHRVNWAHDRLKRARLSSALRRGVWQLTPGGLDLVRTHAQPLATTELHALAQSGRDVPIEACASLVAPHERGRGSVQGELGPPAVQGDERELPA